MYRIALLTEKKKNWKRSAIKAQQISKTLIRNATSAMFQTTTIKRNASSTIAEAMEVAFCASNCALPTLCLLASPWFLILFYFWQTSVMISVTGKSQHGFKSNLIVIQLQIRQIESCVILAALRPRVQRVCRSISSSLRFGNTAVEEIL